MRRRGLDVNRKRCVRSRGGRCLALVCALPTRPWRCPPRSTHAVYSCGRCRCRGAYRLAKRNAPLRRQPLTRLRHGRHSSLVRPVATTRQASRDELPETLRAAAVRPTVRWSAIWKLECNLCLYLHTGRPHSRVSAGDNARQNTPTMPLHRRHTPVCACFCFWFPLIYENKKKDGRRGLVSGDHSS